MNAYSCFNTSTSHQLCLAVGNMKCVLHGHHVMHKLTRVEIYHSLTSSYLIANNPRSFLGKRSTKNNLECFGFLKISRRVLKGTNCKWSLNVWGFFYEYGLSLLTSSWFLIIGKCWKFLGKPVSANYQCLTKGFI